MHLICCAWQTRDQKNRVVNFELTTAINVKERKSIFHIISPLQFTSILLTYSLINQRVATSLLIIINYLFFLKYGEKNMARKFRWPRKATVDMTGKMLAWQKNSGGLRNPPLNIQYSHIKATRDKKKANWPLFIIQVVVFLYVNFRLGYSRLISFCLLFCQFTGKTSWAWLRMMERALPDRKFPTEIFGNFLHGSLFSFLVLLGCPKTVWFGHNRQRPDSREAASVTRASSIIIRERVRENFSGFPRI